jgi:LAO/AO transport system kinase
VTSAAILASLRDRKPAALARAISMVENGSPGFEALLASVHSEVGRARRIGVTGPPGGGKSTLIERLTAHYRAAGRTVGIVAVDPSSPFTGGALLGDRIRMESASGDPGVFIRSMASRGSLGGMATTTGEVADVMDAFGFERILIETVGVGQSELDIATAADTTVVVLVPESGDGIQVMKAGLMEIADVFVVNKADRPGADRLRQELEVAMGLRHGHAFRHVPAHHGVDASLVRPQGGASVRPSDGASGDGQGGSGLWEPPVVLTAAFRDEGVGELVETLDRHFSTLETTGALAARRDRRLTLRTREVLERALRSWLWSESGPKAAVEEALADVASGKRSPYEAAAGVVERFRRRDGGIG